MTWFLTLLLACGAPAPTASDLSTATRVAERWFAAVTSADCDTLLMVSKTQMTKVQCRIEIRMLAERSPILMGVEAARPHPTKPGAIEIEARVLEDGGSENIVSLDVEKVAGSWVVAF